MNLWVGLQQVVALSAGYLADKKWGELEFYRTSIHSSSLFCIFTDGVVALIDTLRGDGPCCSSWWGVLVHVVV